MQKIQVRFTKKAEQDLVEIGQWTSLHFGPQKAEEYVTGLESFCNAITPIGVSKLQKSTYKTRKSSRNGHRVFWRNIGEGYVEIIRIIHTARDWRQLIELKQWLA